MTENSHQENEALGILLVAITVKPDAATMQARAARNARLSSNCEAMPSIVITVEP